MLQRCEVRLTIYITTSRLLSFFYAVCLWKVGLVYWKLSSYLWQSAGHSLGNQQATVLVISRPQPWKSLWLHRRGWITIFPHKGMLLKQNINKFCYFPSINIWKFPIIWQPQTIRSCLHLQGILPSESRK